MNQSSFMKERHWISKQLASIDCANIDCQPTSAQLSRGFITEHLERLNCITRGLNFLELVFQKYDDQTPLLPLRYITRAKPEQKKRNSSIVIQAVPAEKV